MEKIILTGGPGSGKSSILLGLETKGEYVVREAAEDVIKYFQARGIQEPWTKPGFQEKILELQLQREAQIPAGIERVWLDRGIIDGMAYAEKDSGLYNVIKEKAGTEMHKYTRVFLVEPLTSCDTNTVRRENLDEAVTLGNRLAEEYTLMGYKPVRVPAIGVEKRVESVLGDV